MKTIILSLLILIFVQFTTNAQTAIDSFKLVQIETKLKALEEKIFTTDSTYYANNYNVAYEAYFLFDKLSYKTVNFYENIKNDAFLIQLLNVNNPNSLQLRKKILEELQKTIISKVYDLLGKDSTKRKGVFKTIRNIFTSPIAQDVFKLIPFNNTISSIIATVSSIVLPETKSRNVALSNILESTGDIKSIFENSPLQELSKEILPYMEFYDSLNLLNNNFFVVMNIIKSKANELNNFVNTNIPVMQKMTGWSANDGTVEKIKIFDKLYIPVNMIRGNPKFNTAQIVEMQKLYNIANPIIETYTKYLALKNEYDKLFTIIKKDYLKLIDNFKMKNKIFETMLTPLLASLQKIDEPEIVSSALVMASAPVPTQPKYTFAFEKRIADVEETNTKLINKYLENYDKKTEKIKKAIF